MVSPLIQGRGERRSRFERSPATLGRGECPREEQTKAGPKKSCTRCAKNNLKQYANLSDWFRWQGACVGLEDCAV